MSAAPFYWTAADDAEQAVLAREFTKAHYAHRERCAVCREGGPWCSSLLEAFEAIQDWNEGRRLRSKASWLRTREQARGDLLLDPPAWRRAS
jgi:NADH:ubiquinone oxidoreductase subunit F (NADH-binding)